MSSRGGPPRNFVPRYRGASNTNFRRQAYATALVDPDSTAEENGNRLQRTWEIGPSQDADFVLNLDGNVSGHSSVLMVQSENFDFDESESCPSANYTEEVNFRGNLSDGLTTQVSQDVGMTISFGEEEFAFLNEPPGEGFWFYLYPEENGDTLAPVDEPTQGTISESAAAVEIERWATENAEITILRSEKCWRSKNVARTRGRKATHMTTRTAGKRRAAAIVAETPGTTSYQPKRQVVRRQPLPSPPQPLLILGLLLFVCSLHRVTGEPFYQCEMSRGGHALAVPTTITRIPPELPHSDEKVVVTVWTPRSKPVQAQAIKCVLRQREICTMTGFFGSRGIVKETVKQLPVTPATCSDAWIDKNNHGQPLVTRQPGVFITNNTLIESCKWCCFDSCDNVTNLMIEEGSIATLDNHTTFSDLGDTGNCWPNA